MIDRLFIPLLGLFIIALLLGYSTGYLPTQMRWYYERWRWRQSGRKAPRPGFKRRPDAFLVYGSALTEDQIKNLRKAWASRYGVYGSACEQEGRNASK